MIVVEKDKLNLQLSELHFLYILVSMFLFIRPYILNLEYPLLVFIVHMLTVSEQGDLDLHVLRNSPGDEPIVGVLYGGFPGVELRKKSDY